MADTTKIFDNLERRVEKLIARLRAVEADNEKLKGDLAAARRAEKDASDSRGTIERLEREQEAVRERLQRVIESLEAVEGK
jgi:FtsZ-binding cell division protein ZapB